MAGGNFTRGFAAREFPRGLRQGGNMAALPLARSRIPPATQAIQWMKVIFSLLHWRQATQSARTWHDNDDYDYIITLRNHASRLYMTWLNVTYRWFPTKRTRHRFLSDETWYSVVTKQWDIKNELKKGLEEEGGGGGRGGGGSQRTYFQATSMMLTNKVIWVTFGYHCAQQKSSISFQCGVLYHTKFDFFW